MKKPSFGEKYPELIKEWHSSKNGDLTPFDVTPFSDKTFWWKCAKGDDHEWQAPVKARSKGHGCGVCAGRVVVESNCLATLNPKLAREWNSSKNGRLTPHDVIPGSHKRVWWKCPKGNDHQWQATIENRNHGNGCPICSNRKVVKSNCLATINQNLAKQWHPTKNGFLTPSDVTGVSGKKVWWQCLKGKDHEWQATILSRNKGTGCPICSGNKVVKSNCLATLNPELSRQWHPCKNNALTPNDVTASSGKKVWWKCPEGDDHEWNAVIANRNKGIGCPICSNQKVVRSNSFGTVNPELSREWHPTKNGKVTPYDVLPSTNKRIWWMCPKGVDHEWQATLNNRSFGKSCPICSGHKVVNSNSLETLYPEIAKQWHLTKNGKLTPKDVPASTAKKIWWKCPKGDDHEWQATVNHRTNGTGCPKCNPAYSIPELRIFCELKAIFPDVQHRAIIEKNEVDIFIPELNFGIEYDGIYWHQDKHEKDLAKNLVLSSTIKLIRVREEGLPLLGPHDLHVKKSKMNVSTIKKIFKIILSTPNNISAKKLNEINTYMETKDWIATKYFNKMFSRRKHVEFEKSLSFLFPALVREWHPTKNDLLLPEYFTPGSGREIWWRGKCKHVWKDSINHRTSGRACPKCRYKRASQTRLKNKNDESGPQLNMYKIFKDKKSET
jgi:hypothetical protein